MLEAEELKIYFASAKKINKLTKHKLKIFFYGIQYVFRISRISRNEFKRFFQSEYRDNWAHVMIQFVNEREEIKK